MNWKNIWNRLRGLPPGIETELDDELAFHAEMKRRDFERQGITATEAAAVARGSLSKNFSPVTGQNHLLNERHHELRRSHPIRQLRVRSLKMP